MKEMMIGRIVVIGMVIVCCGVVSVFACGGDVVACRGNEPGEICTEQVAHNCGGPIDPTDPTIGLQMNGFDVENGEVGDINIEIDPDENPLFLVGSTISDGEDVEDTSGDRETVTAEAENNLTLFLVGQPTDVNMGEFGDIDIEFSDHNKNTLFLVGDGNFQQNPLPLGEEDEEDASAEPETEPSETDEDDVEVTMDPTGTVYVNTFKLDGDQVGTIEISQEAVTENALFLVGQDVMVNSLDIQGGQITLNNVEVLDEGDVIINHVDIETEFGTIDIQQRSTLHDTLMLEGRYAPNNIIIRE